MSFNSAKENSNRVGGHRSRRDFVENNNVFSFDSHRALLTDPQEIDNSKLDFFDKQTFTKEHSYQFWLGICNIANIFLMICTVLIIVVWVYWLSKLNSNDIVCIDLKNLIIWVVVVYIVGIFSQILGLIAGYVRSSIGYLVCNIVLLTMFGLRLTLDIPTINNAVVYLEGCTQTKASTDLTYYVYGQFFIVLQ